MSQNKESGYFDLPDIRMYYEKYGEGEPLLLLHGWTQSGSWWQPFIPELARHYQVWVPDLRGHGKTGPLPDGFTIQQAAEDVRQFIEAMELAPIRAVGLSFGGIILLELSSENASQFLAQALIGSVYRFDGRDQGPRDFSWKDLPEGFRQQLISTHPFGDDQIDRLFDPDLNYRVDLSDDELYQIMVPSLVISGAEDEVAGVDTARQLDRLLPKSTLFIVPERGHIPFDEQNKDMFIDRLLEFFN